MSKTTMTEDEYRSARDFALALMASAEYLTNRELRKVTRITYDQAIFFFNRMVEEGSLVRFGRGSGTRYRLPKNTAE